MKTTNNMSAAESQPRPSIQINWICDHQVAQTRWPYSSELVFLYASGIRVIISLQNRNKSGIEKLKEQGFEYYEEHVEDGEAPTLEQFDRINSFIDKMRNEKKPVLVHCYNAGRSGTVLTAYLIHCGQTFSQALSDIQTKIPQAEEYITQIQIEALQEYARKSDLLDV